MEDHPVYLPVVRPFFAALSAGEFQAVTSTVTLLEVLVHPFRQKNVALAQKYRDILLNATGLSLISVTPDIAERAAQLRAEFNLRTPDAIQVTVALQTGATHFFTNDGNLQKIPGFKTLVVEKLRVEQ
jgi:predicted nucleic acid-binding protein